MANGFQGPVDAKTMLGMQGAMEQERGFARMWSAGANPTVQAAYQQSAANKGALAANNIRLRYYKKEWEQIRETQIKPLTDQLFEAEKAFKQATASTTMPVPRMVSPEEDQERSELLQGQPPQITTVPGKPTKEGTQNQEAIEQPGPPAPNAARGQGQLGALEMSDQLAIMDPLTGSPTILNSSRGIELMNKATYDFWEQNRRINLEMQDALSEFQGNPYAAQAQDALMENTQKLAGSGATGSLDPQAQQDWMNSQSQFAAEQEEREQGLQQGAFDIRQSEAKMEAQATDARSLAGDPANASAFKPSILKKLLSGKPLTQEEASSAAASGNLIRDLQEKSILRKARQGVFTIPADVVPQTENWKRVLSRDDGYQHEYTAALQDAQNSTILALRQMPPDEMMATLASVGASQRIQDTAAAGLWSDANVVAYVNLLANTPEVMRDANDTAFLLTLPRIEQQQPELTPVIDETIEETIRQVEAIRASRGETPLTEDDRGAFRADRYQTFFQTTYGYAPANVRDITAKRAVSAFNKRRARRRQDYTLSLSEQAQAPAPEQAPEQGTTEEQTPEQVEQRQPESPTPAVSPTPTTGGTSQVSEAMRVYGFESPITTLFEDIKRSRAQQPVPRSKSLSFDTQGRALGAAPVANPYVGQPTDVLQQLADVLKPGTTAHKLITEALTQYAQE